MPAIIKTDPYKSTEILLNHLDVSSYETLPMVDSSGHGFFAGFICTQGARFFAGKLAKMEVSKITNGDGSPDSNWRAVEKGDAVYAIAIQGNGNPREECYIIVDDEGWPMLVGKSPAPFLPPEEFCRPSSAPTFGHFAKQK